MKTNSFCLWVLFLTGGILVAQERHWSDSTGKFGVDAELIKVLDGAVLLHNSKGEEIRVPISRLSQGDQEFVERWQKEKSTKSKGAANKETTTKPTDWLADVKCKSKASREAGFDYNFGSDDPMPEIVVEVEIQGTAAAQAISFGKLKVESFKDGNGKELKMTEEKYGPDITKEMAKISSRGDDFMSEHPQNGVRLQIQSTDKSGKIKMVSEIKGQVEVLTGGIAKQVSVKDISKHKTGDFASDLLEELDLKCEFERTENQVTFKFDGDIKNLASMAFVDRNGKTVAPEGWSSGGWEKSWTFNYDFEKIPAVDMVMEFRIDPVAVTLPFEVKNLKITE